MTEEKRSKTPEEIVEELGKVTDEMKEKNEKIADIDKTMTRLKARAYELVVLSNKANRELQQHEEQIQRLHNERMSLENG